ncbi:MAG TPA: phage exclusion protein Lit family protein, partial [Arenimonas sp.]|nr:phage exclusion protein Lit family protein [Arenimonas sp.]
KHGSSHAIYSIQQEKEADLHATEWILKSSNIAQETQKRQLGIVIAIMALQFVDEPKGSNTYIQSHPSSIERLDYCLDKANAADDSLICAFASTALQFHLSQFDIQANLDGTSIRDVLSGFMVAFATKGRN